MKACRHGHEGIAKLLLALPEVEVNLVNDQGWSALMLAARYGHAGTVTLLLAHPEALVNSVDNEGQSALILATQERGWAYCDVSLALANGPLGIAQLLEEFESRRNSRDLTLEDVVHLVHLALGESVDGEVRSGFESEDPYKAILRSDADTNGANNEGADNDRIQEEPSGTRTDAKRSRGDEEDGLPGAIDNMVAPTLKRRRGEVAVEEP
ncbi:hypothetical protein BKA70DRAFT_1341376 [Coprinopsis sp. MPI-PUGE-AT-0042]|nr:hypothetical protein BKA70DRAFT_1341376 [Coprinopsis sp. MPI-PUGE-AT-0042]